MRSLSPIRFALHTAAAAFLLSGLILAQPAPRPVASPNAVRAAQRPKPQQHLGQWMDNHRNLTLAQQQEALTSLSPHTRHLTIYTSDSRELAVQKAITNLEIVMSPDGPSSAVNSIPAPSLASIELEGFGIGR